MKSSSHRAQVADEKRQGSRAAALAALDKWRIRARMLSITRSLRLNDDLTKTQRRRDARNTPASVGLSVLAFAGTISNNR